ncbi:hypothetical protein PLESTF_001879000 [Pleodorina starrii]|nr:hypothetical protein PLESTF_001879000 [Pleodorina starrii]
MRRGSTGQPKHAAAATAQLRRPRAGGHVPAAVKPFTIDIPDESADAREVLAESPHSPKGGAVPAGKRRCTGDADGGSAPRATSRPAGLVELLRKRRSASGQQGPACAVADRPGSPRLVEGTESEHANISFLHTGVDGEAAGDVPEPAPTAGAATAPGPHAGSAWARRPVFGVAVRQAPAFAELDRGDRRESGGERRPHQQGRQRRAAAAALGGGEKLGRARARHRLAPRSPGPSSESCSGDSEASGSGSLEDLDATAAADDDDENDVSSPSASSGNPASSSDNSEGIWDVPEGPGQNTGSTAMGGCGAEAVPQAARDQSASASGRRQRMQPSGAARAGTKASAPAEADVDRVRSTADAVPPAGISWHPSGSAAAGGRGSVAFGRLRQQLPLAQVGDMAWSHKARGAAKLRPVAASGAAATPLATAAQEEAIGVPQPRSSFTQTEAEAYAYGWPQGTAGEQRERQRSQLGVRKATTSAVPSASFYGRPRTRCASPPPSPSRLHCSGADEGAVTAHESRQPLAVGRSGPAAARDGAVADIADPGHETYTVGGSRARPERAGAGASGRGDNGGAFAEHHGDAPAWMGAAPDHVERHWKGGSAAGLNASGGDAEECCDVVLEEGGGHCAEGGDADPDDAWWDEPLGAHDDEAQPGGSTHGDAEACTQTLDMFLKQVQRGGELQAQRAGQMRLGNLRRTALLGRRGKARGGGATRSGATSGSKGAGGKGRGGANGPGGRSGRGRGGSADILRYSRPIKG